MITRADVIDNAASFLPPRMPSWSPVHDTCIFDQACPAHTFHSSFTTGRRYGVMPYVFGGFDAPAQFLERIRDGACPGGWDRRSPLPAELPGRHTRGWFAAPPHGLGYGTRVLQHLAGIDCSGYILRCWGFGSRRVDGVLYRTRNLADLCVAVARAALRPGDVLLWANHHARLVNARQGRRVSIFEALGGEGRGRPYEEGDTLGRVIHRDVAWDERYVPCSPFPQLIAFRSIPPHPAIQAQFAGSGELAVVEFSLDGVPVPYRTLSTSPLRVGHSPGELLAAGRHEVKMTVINRVAGQEFQDAFVRQFDVPRA
jgi:hypothetical protein